MWNRSTTLNGNLHSQVFCMSKVLFTDYNIALMYTCTRLIDSDTCTPGLETLTAYSRTRELTEDIRDMLDAVVSNTCYRKGDMELISHQEPCNFPVPNACVVRNLPSESNFILEKFLGTWYGLYRLRGSPSMDGYVLHMAKGADNMMRRYFTGVVDNECRKTRIMEIPISDTSSGSSLSFGGQGYKGVFKVIATDYYYAVLYACRRILDDGTCNHGDEFVDIMSRRRSYPSPSIKQKLIMYAKMICKQPGEFHRNDLSVKCPLSLKETRRCSLDDMPVVDNFDATKFEGVWYSYAKLRSMSKYDSAKSVIKRGPNGALIMLNYPVSNGICIESYERTMLPSGDENVADFSRNGGRIRVVYTDYNYALLVGCHEMEDDGRCVPGEDVAMVLSRTPVIPLNSRQNIARVANTACIAETDLKITSHNVECPMSYSGRHSCRVDDILTQEEFTFSKMYGTWHLLANTQSTSSKNPITIKYMMGHAGKIRYALAKPLRDGSCFTSLSYATPGEAALAMYTYEFGSKSGLHKVIYQTSSYRVVYVCDGAVLDAHGTCPPDREDILVWGRSSFITEAIVKQILQNVKHRTCLNVDHFSLTPPPDVFCKLPSETCSMYQFVEQEQFDPTSLYGGWQLLVRTTLIQSKVVSVSLLYYPAEGHGLGYAVAGSLNTGDCFNMDGVSVPDGNYKATYNTTTSEKSVLTRMLYVTKEHFITISCVGGPGEGGVCHYGNIELNIYGKKFNLDADTRKKLIEVAQERTLGCVPTLAMMDVPANDNCEIAAEHCSSSHFQTPDGFDQRMLYGHWNRVMRTTFTTDDLVSTRVRYGHGVDNHLDFTTGYLASTGECRQGSGVANRTERQTATYDMVTVDGTKHNFKVLYVCPHHLILYKCVGGWDETQHCPLVRTLIDILARDEELTAKSINGLQRIVRQRTLSCVPTSMFISVRPTECEVTAPLGRESCKMDDIKQVPNLNTDMLKGVWYQISRSDYQTGRLESKLDGLTLSIEPGDGSMTYRGTGHISGHPKKCLPTTERVLTFELGNAGEQIYEHTRFPGVKSIVKILYADGDHFITYQCFNNSRTSLGLCPHKDEDIGFYSRRRNINQVEKQHLTNILIDSACVTKTDFVMSNHSGYCRLDTGDEKDIQRTCLVDELPAQKNFMQDQFVGVWYEAERTRFTQDNIWESIITHFNPAEKLLMRLTMSGTRFGKCMGPFEAHVRPVSTRAANSGDMYMWIGSQDSYGHPWTVRMRYKVIFTDYQTSIVYTCRHVNTDGTCPRRSQQVDILSRQPDLDPDTRSRMYDIIRNKLCVYPEDLVIPANEADCLQFVQPASDEPEELVMDPTAMTKCPSVMCARYCKHGFVQDVNGCDTCDCQHASGDMATGPSNVNEDASGDLSLPDSNMCVIPMCSMYCEDGYQRDLRGCETCQCAESSVANKVLSSPAASEAVVESAASSSTRHVPGIMVESSERKLDSSISAGICSLPMCEERCDYGYVYDSNQCMTCQCKPNPLQDVANEQKADQKYPIHCPMPMCAQACEHGYANNARGCMTCVCNNPLPQVDVGTLCRPIQCSISCEEGFLSDLHGCKICECAEQSQSLDTVGVADHDQSQIGRAFVGNAEASVLEEVETILQKLIKYFF